MARAFLKDPARPPVGREWVEVDHAADFVVEEPAYEDEDERE